MKHGLTETRLYRIFTNMKQRCYNPNNPKYANYGGKGVEVCNEWLDNFQTFYDWAMANGYHDYLTIDRIDSDSKYAPDNCRWVSHDENRSSRKKFTNDLSRDWLRDLREQKGISQAQIAQTAGISQQMYSYIENGKRCEPSKCDVEKKIAEALGFDWTRFFEDATEQP